MELYYGTMPQSVVISETGGHTDGGNSVALEDYERDLICLAGTVAEHIYRGDFTKALAQILSGIVPDGANSDFSKMVNKDKDFLVAGMLSLYSTLLSERWIILTHVADELLSRGELDAEDLDKIAKRLSTAYRSMERLAGIRKIKMI